MRNVQTDRTLAKDNKVSRCAIVSATALVLSISLCLSGGCKENTPTPIAEQTNEELTKSEKRTKEQVEYLRKKVAELKEELADANLVISKLEYSNEINSDSTSQDSEDGTQETETSEPTRGPDVAAKDAKDAKDKPKHQHNANSLHKNNTLLVLAYQHDIRANYLTSNIRPYISTEQFKKAKTICREYDRQYDEIMKKRSAILEVAMDGDNVKEKILQNRIEIADLNAKIRTRISREILTKEQRKQVWERYNQSKTD